MGDSARSLRVLLPENEFAFPLPLFLSSHLPLVCFSCSLLSISVCVQAVKLGSLKVWKTVICVYMV